MFRIRTNWATVSSTVQPNVYTSSTQRRVPQPNEEVTLTPETAPAATTALTPHRFDGSSEAEQERREHYRRQQRRANVVTARPASGAAYPVATSTIIHAQDGSDGNATQPWMKDDLPGGKKLFYKLVFAFTLVSVIGGVFVTLGAVYFNQALQNNTLLLVFCIIGIVAGSVMVIGSIILGKTIISTKWRLNMQPTYRNMAPTTARFVPTVSEADEGNEEPTVEIQMSPPSYEESANSPTSPSVFIISQGSVNVSVADSQAHTAAPPSYADPENVELPQDAPPMYSVADPHVTYRQNTPPPPPTPPSNPRPNFKPRDVQQILSGQITTAKTQNGSTSQISDTSTNQNVSSHNLVGTGQGPSTLVSDIPDEVHSIGVLPKPMSRPPSYSDLQQKNETN